jgi:hypothetical protein
MKFASSLLKIAIAMLLFTRFIYAQESNQSTQSAYGTIIDDATQEPIYGASVELINYVPLKMAITDEFGKFKIEGIPVGKHRFLVTSEDYEILIVPEVQILAGKQTSLDVSIEQLPRELREIVVKSNRIKKTTKDLPNNHMALTGIRSFTIEEVKRYPISLEDPARLVAKFAGVARTHTETGLIVRGNNPNTLLWRIEGLPIPSPNHLSFKEIRTGYLPMFNIYLLRNSDFMHGPAPAEYGNTIGGTLDLGLRNGNTQNYEGSLKIALEGVEGFFEGPLGKKGRTSFVIGGRYSFLELFSNLFQSGSVPNTEDLSFKVHTAGKKYEMNIFGIGGISTVEIDVSKVSTNSNSARYVGDAFGKKTYGLLGANLKKQLNSKKGYIYTVLGTNYNSEQFKVEDSIQAISAINSTTIGTTLSSYLHYVFNGNNQIRTGITATHYYLDYKYNKFKKNIVIRDYQGQSMLIQLHAQWLHKFSKKLKMNLGINGQYLLLNNTYGISPRFEISWQLMPSHRLSTGYSWNHQIQPWEVYLNQSNRVDDRAQLVNYNLEFSQNHHFSLTYDWTISNNWRLKAEAYFQYLMNIPVNVYEPTVSLINISSTENLLEKTHFTNRGLGQTYGFELTLEKFFSEGYYGMLTATYFDSKYKGGDNIWRNTETNNNFIGNLLIGKEFKIGAKKNNRFFLDFSYTLKFGNYYTPVDLAASMLADRQVSDWSQAYTQRYPRFHNLDIRVGILINQKKKQTSHKIFLEVSNALNQKVIYREAYDPYTRTQSQHSYVGVIPNLSYRLSFGFKQKSIRRR